MSIHTLGIHIITINKKKTFMYVRTTVQQGRLYGGKKTAHLMVARVNIEMNKRKYNIRFSH